MSLPGEYETSGGINEKLYNIVTYGLGDDFYNKYPAAVKSTTVENLTALAQKRLLPDNLILVVIGDRAVIESKIKELNLGPIQLLDENGDLKK
jgi:zinc protease